MHFSVLKLVSIDFLGWTVFGGPGPILAAKVGPAQISAIKNGPAGPFLSGPIFSVTGQTLPGHWDSNSEHLKWKTETAR